MAKHIENEVEYYYDSHPTKEDLMGETSFHADLVHYLVDMLRWMFRDQSVAIYQNLNFYLTPNPREYPLAPDIAVIKDMPFRPLRSWKIERKDPVPQVVFEIASQETWRTDVYEKPLKYTRMGVEEFIFYDPHEPPLWRVPPSRPRMWRMDREQGMLVPVSPTADGRIWSEQLESWLVPDGMFLRLYDRTGAMRLTQGEEKDRLASIEAQKSEVATRRALEEHRRAELEARRALEEHRRAELEARRAAQLAEKLRALGIDPDQV